MSKEREEPSSGEKVIECPYDKDHRVESPRMERHLTECRQLAGPTEKTVCPFNEKHVVYAPEIDYHKAICPERPPESDDTERNGEKSDFCDEQIENESSYPSGETPSKIEKISLTGCVGGQNVGVRGNFYPDFEQEGDADKKPPSVDRADERNGECGEESANSETQEPLSRTAAIEKQLSQSDSDTAETDASVCGESDQERFDYLKYKPSNEEREEFLKLIGQQKASDSCEEKQAAMDQQAYEAAMWGQSYGYVPSQYPAYPAAYFPYHNCYPMMTAIPTQHPYANGYFAPSMLPPPGTGFIHGAYNCGHNGRAHYHHKRRNYQNHRHPRYNNNHCHYHDSHSHETDSNSSSQSDAGLSDDSITALPISTSTNGKHSNDEPSTKKSHGRGHQNGAPQRHKDYSTPGQNGAIKHFVDIGIVQERATGSDLSDSSQEKEAESGPGSQQKSEQQKQMRKLKKKIAEIVQLEKKRSTGATLDCDQLKKLSRKKDFEIELQYLSQGNLGN